MSLLRNWFGDRRKKDEEPVQERRKVGLVKNWRSSGDRLDRAVDELYKTVTMTRAEFCEMMQREKECPKLVENDIAKQVQFQTFADICEFKSDFKNGSLMAVCKNPDHENARSGIASCNAPSCPKLRPK